MSDKESATGSDYDSDSVSEIDYAEAKRSINRKKKSGGFQSMGLSSGLLKAIQKKGYKVPTPVQRKAIPLLLEGRDVVAMARTGSGKTAAFLVPMIERLKAHQNGIRALILSPSRELALQTMKFTKAFGGFGDLRCALVIGGDGMEEQFAQLTSNPDIVIATPGRLLHLLVEMNLDLKSVEYLVFDEADRLFEMGFADTLKEIMFKLNPNRQTALFSATLPKSLVEFASAGLKDPTLVRLDTDNKMSPDLQLCFFPVRENEKEAALIYLIRSIIPQDHSTIVFMATKHHVEYYHELLNKLDIPNSYIYGSLDQSARLLNLQKFRNGKTKFLLVTDVAARGIDIPLLNNVIHFDFTDKSKLFLHRSGRAARAGRAGTAYAFVNQDDLPYLIDLQMFLGKRFLLAGEERNVDVTKDILLGGFPSHLYQSEYETLNALMKADASLQSMSKVAQNGMKQYMKTKSQASKESYQRAKEISKRAPIGSGALGVHPLLKTDEVDVKQTLEQANILDQLRKFRPQETIFEIKKMGLKPTPTAELMKTRRMQFDHKIQKTKEEVKQAETLAEVTAEQASDELVKSVFSDVVAQAKKRKNRADEKLLSYFPSDYQAEKQYAVNDNFMSAAQSATLDLTGDDKDAMRGQMKWDKKRKRFVRETIGADNKKRLKTDSGAYIPASYKTDAFQKWQKKHKAEIGDELVDTRLASKAKKFKHSKVQQPKIVDKLHKNYEKKSKKLTETKGGDRVKNELKDVNKIVKEKKMKEKRREKNARPSKKKAIRGKPRRK